MDWISLLQDNAAANVVALTAIGMGLAFFFADQDSPTSRSLALCLDCIGLSILFNTNFVMGLAADTLPWWTGLGGLIEATAIIAGAEWVLRIRRTIPAGELDTRGGDYALRIAQGSVVLYALLSIALPQMRAEYFLQALDQGTGWPPFEFYIFATPLFLAIWGLVTAVRLVLNRKPEQSEAIRLVAFAIGGPLTAVGLVTNGLIAPYTTVIGLMILLIGAVRYHVIEGRKGAFMRRFLSPQVADLVRRQGLRQSTGSETKVISVVACDIRGYTAFAERWPSAHIIQGLEDYYDLVGGIAARYEATIKDYAGDGVLLLVGAPLHCDDHAARAVALADQLMQEVSAELDAWCDQTPDNNRAEWCAETPLGIGVGVATGEATVGLVGGVRMEYVAVGSVVNRASRLCDAAASGQVLIDDPTHKLIAQREAASTMEPQGGLELKGFDGLTAAWALRSTPGTVKPA